MAATGSFFEITFFKRATASDGESRGSCHTIVLGKKIKKRILNYIRLSSNTSTKK